MAHYLFLEICFKYECNLNTNRHHFIHKDYTYDYLLYKMFSPSFITKRGYLDRQKTTDIQKGSHKDTNCI